MTDGKSCIVLVEGSADDAAIAVRGLPLSRRVPVLVGLLLFASISLETHAQTIAVQDPTSRRFDSLPVPLGTRVRLSIDPRLEGNDSSNVVGQVLYVGMFAGTDSGSVFVKRSETHLTDRFSRAAIVGFERSRGRRPSRRAVRWSAIAGGLVGFPLGYSLGQALSGMCSSAECVKRSTASQVPFFILVGAVGAAVGSGIGAGSAVLVQAIRGERWESVRLAQ